MGKHEHAPQRKQSPNRKRAEPGPAHAPSAQAERGQGELQVGPGRATPDAGVHGSALGDERLVGAQRQSLASQLAQLLGNQRLQRLVAPAKGGGTLPPAGWPLRPGPAVRHSQDPLRVQAKNGDKAAPKAPLELLRDELGDVFVDESACLQYIAQLGPQVSTVRNDKWLMGRMAAAFNAREMLQAVQQLALELKWAVYWIDRAREAGAVGSKGYDTLIAAAPARENAELIGWPDVLGVVKTNRPGNPLTMFPPLVADNPLLARVFGAYAHFVDWTLDAAGAQQLLHFLLGHNPKAMVGALDKSSRWTPFLGKLPKGTGLSPADKAAMLNLANAVGDAKHQAELFEVRFDVSASKGGIPWESKGLMRAWQLLTILPVSDVEGNPALDLFLRGGKGGTEGESDMSTYVKYWYEASKLGELDIKSYTDPTDPMNKMKIFDGTIIHEIGHAVDGAYGYSDSYGKTVPGGGWESHTPETAVDAMVAASPWKIAVPKEFGLEATAATKGTWVGYLQAGLKWLTEVSLEENARKACINAATSHKPVSKEANAIDPSGKLWKAISNQAVVKAVGPALEERAPWMHHDKQTKFGSRYYHEGYKGSWVSYLSDRYDAKLSKYQFRDPRDWFAETYACYYMTVDPGNPKSEDAGKKVPEPIKTWFTTSVAKTNPPPGAKKAGP